LIQISSRPVSVDKVVESVRTNAAGCVVTFVGTVRNSSDGVRVSGLELEAARDLALKDLRRIAKHARTEFDIQKVSVVHRLGALRVGDTIVAIAVSAAHRKDGFAACRYVIEELKKTTPIWKREISGRAQKWVEGGR
jgi:molybdopterin synthase catalytic subunit